MFNFWMRVTFERNSEDSNPQPSDNTGLGSEKS
jgi:hypothetical protein